MKWMSEDQSRQNPLGGNAPNPYTVVMKLTIWQPVLWMNCRSLCVGILLALSPLACGEFFRLSKVAAKESPDTERFEIHNGDTTEVLFVEKMAIITGADVKSAMRSPVQEDALTVMLKDEGGKKLGDATADARGDMRLAILIDGKVVMAPTVSMKLGKNFVIDGLKEYPGDDLDLLGWQIEGRDDNEIVRLLREKAMNDAIPRPKRPEPEYYNDEEYAALKMEREEMGVFQLDRLPDKDELDSRLKVGMTMADVLAEFGKASRRSQDDKGNVTALEYELAPEKRSMSTEMRPDGFRIQFDAGKVTRWDFHRWSSSPREGKPPKGGRRALNAKIPQADLAADNFDIIRWVEEIKLGFKDGEERPTVQDLMDLVSIVFSAAQAGEDTAMVEANCSVVAMLADDFPEVGALRKEAKDGKVSLLKLHEVLSPYMLGDKRFPGSDKDGN
jgi:hypothetical protein